MPATMSEIEPDPQAPYNRRIAHHFTVDVEEYFQVSAFEAHVPRSSWDGMESRMEVTMERLLRLLDEAGARGTFFVLGWVAERYPGMVRELAAAGHEVASHGQDHRRITELTAASFRDSVRRSKDVLEQLTGERVLGFRAPSFSIVPGCEWALDVLIEEGYVYDSSLFPVRRKGYGYPAASPEPAWLERPAGRLLEVPPATLPLAGQRIPAGGGAYFRHLPYALTASALRWAERRNQPGTFYIHPWELDVEQPRVAAPVLTRWRHYGGLSRTSPRIRKLLVDFNFHPIRETFEAKVAA